MEDVILRITRKAISHLSQQLAICIGRHKSLRQNNEGSRSSNQLCRPFAVIIEQNSGILKKTGLTDGAHCYVNGIVKQKRRSCGTKSPNFHKMLQSSSELHSLACFVCCWYSGSRMQGREWGTILQINVTSFHPSVLSIQRKWHIYIYIYIYIPQTQHLFIKRRVAAKFLASYEAILRLYKTVRV